MGTKAANDGDPEIALHCFLLPTHSSNSRLKTNLNVMTESVRLLQIERAAKNQESFLKKILVSGILTMSMLSKYFFSNKFFEIRLRESLT